MLDKNWLNKMGKNWMGNNKMGNQLLNLLGGNLQQEPGKVHDTQPPQVGKS